MPDNFTIEGIAFGSKFLDAAHVQKVRQHNMLPTAAVTSVAANSGASVSLLAANTARRSATVVNGADTRLFLKYGTGASSASLSYIIEAGGTWEMPLMGYSGDIHGRWEGTPTGAAYITELTES